MYLLDQGLILALLKGNRHASNKVNENLENCYIPAIVAAELYRMNYPKSKKDSMIKLIDSFLVVEFGKAQATAYGKIQQNLERNNAAANIVDVMIGATALSLNATIVTHRFKQFNIISQGLNFENWITSERVLSPRENKPGILYQVLELMKELNINIIEGYGSNNGFEHGKRHSLVVDVPNRNIFEQLQSRLINVTYEPNTYQYQQSTQIKFDCIPSSLQIPNKKFSAEGRDRVGLLADITKLIAEQNVNIIAFGCQIGENLEKFHIFFCLYGELKKLEWQALLEKIKKVKDNCNNDIDANLTSLKQSTN